MHNSPGVYLKSCLILLIYLVFFVRFCFYIIAVQKSSMQIAGNCNHVNTLDLKNVYVSGPRIAKKIYVGQEGGIFFHFLLKFQILKKHVLLKDQLIQGNVAHDVPILVFLFPVVTISPDSTLKWHKFPTFQVLGFYPFLFCSERVVFQIFIKVKHIHLEIPFHQHYHKLA